MLYFIQILVFCHVVLKLHKENMGDFKQQPKGFATKAIHAGQDPEQWEHLAVVPPIVTSTTFKQHSPAEPKVH